MGILATKKAPVCTYVHQTAMYRNCVAVLEEGGTIGKTREGMTCESRGDHFTETGVPLAPKVWTWHDGEGNSIRNTPVHREFQRMAT